MGERWCCVSCTIRLKPLFLIPLAPGAVSPQLAALAAELLGFNPDLVMPELARQLAAATAQLQQDAPQ